MKKIDKLLLTMLILGFLLLITSLFFSNYIIVPLKILLSIIMIIISTVIIVCSIITYDRNSYDDLWIGYRCQILQLCILLIVWSIAIYFV